MVSFRLSPEEYEKFHALCASQGVRTLSDLARTGLYRLIDAEGQVDSLYFEVGDLRKQVYSIAEKIDRLSGSLSMRKTAGG
jgi:hypothetical protein